MKGQLSIEMIILIVVILAVLALVVTNLEKLANIMGGAAVEKANKTAQAIANSCTVSAECPEGQECINGVCQ